MQLDTSRVWVQEARITGSSSSHCSHSQGTCLWIWINPELSRLGVIGQESSSFLLCAKAVLSFRSTVQKKKKKTALVFLRKLNTAGSGGCVHTFNPSTRGRAWQILSSGLAWSTLCAPGQPRLHRETLCQFPVPPQKKTKH